MFNCQKTSKAPASSLSTVSMPALVDTVVALYQYEWPVPVGTLQ